MSRAFVKEDAQGPDEDPPERPLSDLPNYCTPRGLALYQAEEAKLLAALAGYEGAQEDPLKKKRKRELERDLRWVRARLEAAIPVDPAKQPKDEVRFGASVSLVDGDGKTRRLRIVGEDEATEDGENLSWASPFAQAMFGLKAGQGFERTFEDKIERWTIAKLEYD